MIPYLKSSVAATAALGKQKYDESVEYHPGRFCITLQVPEGTLFYSTLTKEMVLLEEGEETVSQVFKYLVEHWFYVPLEFNEDSLVAPVRQTARLLAERQGKQTTFVILTTTACNARCYYCYEAGRPQSRMSRETADRTIDYIKTHGTSKVSIQWFGGEPLYNVAAIDYISSQLKAVGISYTSRMISNGYLFDRDMIARAVELWHLKKIQITLDGTEDVYNKTKRYVETDGDSPFKRVIRNISLLLDAGVVVDLRMNVGKHNFKDLVQLVDNLEENIGKRKGFVPYAAPLFQYVEDTEVLQNAAQLQRKCYGLAGTGPIGSKSYNTYRKRFRRVSFNQCMADFANCILVSPEGNLGRCEHYYHDPVGTLENGVTDREKYDKWNEMLPSLPECAKCPIVPDCVRLSHCDIVKWTHGACPNNGNMDLTRKQVTDLMLEYYEKHKENAGLADDAKEVEEAEADGLRW